MKKATYILSRGLFYTFAVFFCFVFVFSILAFVEHYLEWNIPFVDLYDNLGQSFAKISLPFIDFKVEFIFSFLIVIGMWIGLLFYVIYFYMLKEFFRIFIEDEAFSQKSLKRLKTFLYINLIPIVYALGLTIVQVIKSNQFKFEEDQGIAIFHLVIAFLVYLYMDLLKKGQVIKQENDLTI